jgi:uncharacterized protein with FMN-binding domain
MRRAVAALLGAGALALPLTEQAATAAAAAATTKKKVVVVTKSVTGSLGQADRWGQIEVVLTVRKTTKTVGVRKKTILRKITAVGVPIYPDHTDRSVFINQQALPYLKQEVLHAQMDPNIELVSGATATSFAFQQSLQSALLKAKKV